MKIELFFLTTKSQETDLFDDKILLFIYLTNFIRKIDCILLHRVPHHCATDNIMLIVMMQVQNINFVIYQQLLFISVKYETQDNNKIFSSLINYYVPIYTIII